MCRVDENDALRDGTYQKQIRGDGDGVRRNLVIKFAQRGADDSWVASEMTAGLFPNGRWSAVDAS